MFVPKNRGFKRQYVYGGSGIFDSIASFFTRLFSSNAARQLASTALDVGKSAAKEVGKKAVDVGKNVAIDAGKKLIEKGVTKAIGSRASPLTPKSQSILQKYVGVPMQLSSPDAVAKKAQDILSKYINTGAQSATTNINSLIDGSGFTRSPSGMQQKVRRACEKVTLFQPAIAIQDLVRKLNAPGIRESSICNGSGLKVI